MPKRFNAPFYTETYIGLKGLFKDTHLPGGYLYSKGRYKTKITPDDLPSSYVSLMVYKAFGYLSVDGVKDMVYKPNYHINHMHKDDFLYISFNAPITSTINQLGFEHYHGYDVLLWGWSIVTYIKAVREAKSYDIEAIAEEVRRKERFFLEKYPEECQYIRASSLLE